ncbi:MAG: 7-cyano-7-deazaguanine synthase, partial [Selenomonadaceae bacterium]|nr:7-cyano-7-deazaguanine synthase [Selenomonadaceae bacterium]
MEALVLLSGGIDSTTCLAIAVEQYSANKVTALSAYYGQKHIRELEAADHIADYYGVNHLKANLSKVYRLSDSPLLMTSSKKIRHQSYAEQLAEKDGTVDTYVPFRNGLFLSYAAAIAISIGAGVIYYGAHADDAAGRAYPDCTPEFFEAM